jgi:general secretion pathway protein A
MYESFYGLSGKPFQLNPDPSFYFGSRQHRRAMAYLEYGLHQSEGFIVITGEVGAGKTTMVRNLIEKLDPRKVIAAQLMSTQLDPSDMLRMVVAAFGLQTKQLQKSDLLLMLEAYLLSLTEKGMRAIIVVDEAQNLVPAAVEELRMLSNFQIGDQALLQSFLVGQPEFRQMLQGPQMEQLRQRVIASCHVGPMDADDTRQYVKHRLNLVGWRDDPEIEPDLFDVIYRFSTGIPRRINTLCDRLLLAGFLGNKHKLTVSDAREVAAEIRQEIGGLAGTSGISASNSSEINTHLDLAAASPNVTRLKLSPRVAAQASVSLADASANLLDERLLRLEKSVSMIMKLLQDLLDGAARKDE